MDKNKKLDKEIKDLRLRSKLLQIMKKHDLKEVNIKLDKDKYDYSVRGNKDTSKD